MDEVLEKLNNLYYIVILLFIVNYIFLSIYLYIIQVIKACLLNVVGCKAESDVADTWLLPTGIGKHRAVLKLSLGGLS